jgi:hypothetical protein
MYQRMTNFLVSASFFLCLFGCQKPEVGSQATESAPNPANPQKLESASTSIPDPEPSNFDVTITTIKARSS